MILGDPHICDLKFPLSYIKGFENAQENNECLVNVTV